MARKKGMLVKADKVTNPKKEKIPYIYKTLDESLQQKTLLASEAQIYKLNQEGLVKEPIILQLSTEVPTTNLSTKEFTRRMINIPNRLRLVKNTSILLVTKDPVDNYRIPITLPTAITTDTFTDIIGFKKFKSLVGTSKKALKTFHEYDIIIVDNRLHKFLPKLLAPTIFCKSSQNFPLMLQFALPTSDVIVIKRRKEKDELDLDYIQSQIKAWCKNTTFVPSTGSSLSIIVGYPNMSGSDITENIDAVLTYLTDKKFKPIGGIIPDGINGIADIHLRANDKSVPVLKKGSRD
ncbi:hypothetical protein C6P40_000332 [Pichia californica]|uniref:Ribosome biogenesis protein UTP30 n=1 Tax=Pichia californica TaxID=460514 RepID=A0A9P6WKY3_9ASCO|nr:hypothetical protein C6P42_001758 [[Candida] californica]KAG0688932.1 hypothetical protein C6P40_000332 [[Candida] californica]